MKSVEEYKQLLITDSDVGKEDESEYFLITYLSDNLLNITIFRDVMPHNGQIQHFFNSVLYDLRTGEKLKISDFLNIQTEQLTKLLKNDGYFVEEYSDAENSIAMKPIDSTDEFVNEIVKYIFPNDSIDVLCTDYYFTKEENEIHLRFKYQCSGPQFLTYGISINKLIPYIKYFDFKNALKLWGTNITSLVGTDYNLLGNTIEFKDYSIKETAGYFMKTGPKYPNKKFGIVTWSNAKSWFYMFLKYNVNSSKTIITDVCEIDKEYLKDKYFITMDQETSKEYDPETIAILESKVGLKKIKTWQVNKQTGKIETIEH